LKFVDIAAGGSNQYNTELAKSRHVCINDAATALAMSHVS